VKTKNTSAVLTIENQATPSIRHKKIKRFFRKLLHRSNLILLEILTFVLLIAFFTPMLIVFINAAKTKAEIDASAIGLPSDWLQFFVNAQTVMTAPTVKYFSSFMNSLIITSGSLVVIGICSAMAAWVLVRTKKKYSNFIFLFFVSGLVIPFQVVMLPLVRLLDIIRLADTYIGVILVYLGFGAPLSVFMFHGFMKSIPIDIEEAATIDGCSKTQMFFKVILPILKPIFVTLLILNGLWIWNDYLLPSLVIGIGGAKQTLPLAVANLVGSFVKQWDLQMTAVLLAAIPVIILFLFAQKYIIKGMTSGAIK